MGKISPNLDKGLRCTQVNCTCPCFRPGKTSVRTCDHCRHGWVVHALDKLLQPPQSMLPGTQVEVAHPGVVFDLASLVLYGATALPIRLKILLDRLLSVLTQDQVLYILETLGWTIQDYCRGYIVQDSSGGVLDRWALVCREEEVVTLQQFLRFGETRPIVELMTFQDSDVSDISRPTSSDKTDSNIRAFIESVGQSGHFEKGIPAAVQHFENSATNLSMLLPFQFPSTAPLLGLAPPSRLGGLRGPERSKQCEVQQDHSESSRSVSPYGNPVSPVPVPDAVKGAAGGTENRSGTAEPKHQHEASSKWSLSRQPHSNEDQWKPASNPGDERGQRPRHLSDLQDNNCGPSNNNNNNNNNNNSPCSLSTLTQRLFLLGSSPSCSSLPIGRLFPEPPLSHRKGRVCCGVCGKSFYDKGTLKIHYNAVHLKVKHRCTMAGCSMVFSSLRSRNRHSANPNPRLHMGPPRHTPTPHGDSTRWGRTHTLQTHTYSPPHEHQGSHDIARCVPSKHIQQQHASSNAPWSHPGKEPARPSSPDLHSGHILPRAGHPSVGMAGPLSPLQTQLLAPSGGEVKVLSPLHSPSLQNSPPAPHSSSTFTVLLSPLYSSSLLPDQSDDSSGSVGGAKVLLSFNKGEGCASADHTHKKKPRKSSTPLKIQKEGALAAEAGRGEEEEIIGSRNEKLLNWSLSNK